MINSLCIVGGGNAGFMSALMLRSSFPNLKIKLIKSDKIPTIGVGEGSNEYWKDFAFITGITTFDVIKHADATFKHGIKLQGWRNGSDIYYHSLPEFLSVQDNLTGLPYTLLRLISGNLDPEKLVWKLAVEGKIFDPLNVDFAQFHFNTFKLNSYFETLCNERNIKIIEDTVVDVILDDTGHILSLIGEKSCYQNFDFFIDTSGFSRVLSKKLGSKWCSYNKYLAVNSALAFPSALPANENTPSFTLAKARRNGWSWHAPVQGRFGNGYVFADQFCKEEDAFKEIQSDYNDEIIVGRKIKFDSGKIDKFWLKNCLSVGLSGSFIEPLEATNIGTTIYQIKALLPSLVCWRPGAEQIENRYNKIFDEVSSNILDFVQIHYISQREDTEFWKWCKYDMPLTDFNQETLDYFKKNFVNYNFFHRNQYELFDELDWAQVMHGLQLFDMDSINQLHRNFRYLDKISIEQCNNVVNDKNNIFVDHNTAIKIIKEMT